jgi:hypothetical protein
MSLGNALLQPHTLSRSSFDDMVALAEDVARVAAIVLEDSASAGPMVGAVERALVTVGNMLAESIEPRRSAAEARLRGRIAGPRAALEALARDAEDLAQDPAAILGLIRQLLTRLKGLADSATLPAIRAELQFWKSLVQEDLGLSPDFLARTIAGFIAAFRSELAAVTTNDLAGTRRLRLCESVLIRLSLRAADLRPPDLEIEPLAREIEKVLRNSGIAGALREFSCALDGIQGSLDGMIAIGAAVRRPAQPVGAGVASAPDSAEYSWYASWLLADENIPLIGLGDLSDPRGFLRQLAGIGDVERHLRVEMLTTAERSALSDYENIPGTPVPSRELLLQMLAGVNRAIQTRPILSPIGADEDLLADSALTEEIRELRSKYEEDQSLFLYNRRLLEHVFQGKLNAMTRGWFSSPGDFAGNLGDTFLSAIAFPRHQVFVTGDRRFVMCDDKPIHSGENVKWYEAPMFSASERGQMWFQFQHISPQACEILAQVLAATGECGKSIWHLVDTQPGHEAQAGTVGAIEIADTLQQFLFGKPVSGYFLEGGPSLRAWGKSLDSFFGLKGIAVFFSSLQGLHTAAPFGNALAYWLTVILGDVFRTLGPIQMINTIRDLVLSFVTLLNFRGPQDGPSGLPSNPSRNHSKQGPFVSLSDSLFAMLLMSLYPRDNYSIFIWDPSEGGVGDRKAEAFLGHWLGGSAGLGLLAGLAGSFVAQVIAWGEDYPRFFKTGGISAAKMFGLYWILNYVFIENSTDGGRYRAGGGAFAGYPPKDPTPSPYRLPYPGGTSQYVGQGNLALFSHNLLANSNFATGVNATQQTYAFDFGHDLRQPIACARAGVVWSFTENIADSSTATWNVLIIRHATIDPVHDDFGQGPVQTYSVYGHLATNGVTQAPAFGGTSPGQESVTAGTGTAVAQGALIALAGDTGTSFHNHLHLHVLPDDGTGQPNATFAIPFVFQDVGGNGVPTSRTWHRSGNA